MQKEGFCFASLNMLMVVMQNCSKMDLTVSRRLFGCLISSNHGCRAKTAQVERKTTKTCTHLFLPQTCICSLLHLDPHVFSGQLLQLSKLKLDVHNVQNESLAELVWIAESLKSTLSSALSPEVVGVIRSSDEKSKLTVSTPHSRNDLFRPLLGKAPTNDGLDLNCLVYGTNLILSIRFTIDIFSLKWMILMSLYFCRTSTSG